jgi:hypothetical protein
LASLLTPSFTVFGFLDGATAISRGQDDPLELRFGAQYKLTKTVGLNGGVGFGLSDGSPDYSLSGGLSARF